MQINSSDATCVKKHACREGCNFHIGPPCRMLAAAILIAQIFSSGSLCNGSVASKRPSYGISVALIKPTVNQSNLTQTQSSPCLLRCTTGRREPLRVRDTVECSHDCSGRLETAALDSLAHAVGAVRRRSNGSGGGLWELHLARDTGGRSGEDGWRMQS